MAGQKTLVSPPTFLPREFGLFSVVESRFEVADVHWRNGVIWEANCGLGDTTYDDCALPDLEAPAAKTDNIDVYHHGATPFTVFTEVDCAPVGYSPEEQAQRAIAALQRVEEYQVELAFWNGRAAATANVVYPHLAHATNVFDSGSAWLQTVRLQSAVEQVTGVALDVVEGIGRLEAVHAECANGAGILHVTIETAEAMASAHLLERRGNQLRTPIGNLVAVGAGYTGTNPSNTATAGVHWAYATSPVFAYRSEVIRVGTRIDETLDREVDTVKTIAERTYVLGYDCCLHGVPISLGGIVTGTFNSAT